MARTWGGIEHRLIATTHVSSSWVRAVHLVQVDQTKKAAAAARHGGNGEHPVQVYDPAFALQLFGTLAFMQTGKLVPNEIKMILAALAGKGLPAGKVLPKELKLLLGTLTGAALVRALRQLRMPPRARRAAMRKKVRRAADPRAGPEPGTHMAVSFLGGPTCMYPFSDQRDYNRLRSASSVGKAFHRHYYRKGRGLAYYQITAEAARSSMF